MMVMDVALIVSMKFVEMESFNPGKSAMMVTLLAETVAVLLVC